MVYPTVTDIFVDKPSIPLCGVGGERKDKERERGRRDGAQTA